MEKLFSYGTLQLESVQMELFGRTIAMAPDSLVGYKKEQIKIKAEPVMNLSGEEEYAVISYTGHDADVIEGVVLSITREELEYADEYETREYKRILVTLKSGKQSWVYVKNDKD